MARFQDNLAQKPFKQRAGCTLPLAEAGGLLIVIGGVGINRWAGIGTLPRVAAIVAIVLGTLLIVPLVVALLVQMWIKRGLTRLAEAINVDEPLTVGERIIERNKALLGDIHEYRAATDDDFAGVDRDYYDQATRDFTGKGCRQMGDVVNATIEKVNGVAPVIRLMLTPDSRSVISFYHLVTGLNQRMVRGRQLKMCSVETEFSDRTFLAVHNLGDFGHLTPPPEIQKVVCPLETTPLEVLALHEGEMAKIQGKTPVVLTTLADVLAMQQRQNAIVAAHRKEIGYADPEEVRKISLAGGRSEEAADRSARSVAEALEPEEE